jgi:hypothetical protein
MVDEPTEGPTEDRGFSADEPPEETAGSGWVTTKVAAEALGVDPRTVRTYIKRGELAARVEGEGVEKAYLVSIDSVYSLRERRARPRKSRKTRDSNRDISAQMTHSAEYAEDITEMVRDLTTQLIRSSSEAAELRTRLELTEQAESSRREALEQRLETERVRRELAEQERDKLAAELENLLQEPPSEPRESPETVSEEFPGTHAPPTPDHPVERPSWWRRFFGLD